MKTLPTLTRASHYELRHIRAIDGDTIIAHIVLPLGILCQRRIRLKGFFAPEHRGASPELANAAQQALQSACDRCQCMIQSHGMREDRYGRIAATLWLDGAPADPAAVLGCLLLTPAAHRAEVERARSQD